MPEGNITFVKEFFIVGFPGLQVNHYGLVSAALFLVYLSILMGNGLFLFLFTTNNILRKPVYFFYMSLALSDILFSTTTLPKIIAKYWFQSGSISFAACFLQMYLVHYFSSVNSFVLASMAIDRYVAICYPFQYHTVMSNRNVLILSVTAWIVAHIFVIVMVARALPLPYCGANTILHCYCDHVSVTQLACTDRTPYSASAFALAMVVLLGSLAIIVVSYFSIVLAVLRISGTQGKLKTFSTCSSQLIIIGLYFLPRCFNYLSANLGIIYNVDLKITIILLYSLLPPMINPLLYSLRTEEVKKILIKLIKRTILPDMSM